MWRRLVLALTLAVGSTAALSAPVALAAAPSTPAAPTGTAGNTQIALSWMAPASNGPAITDYVVELSTNGGGTWLPVTEPNTPATGLTVTGLTNGTGYQFRIAAVNADGTSGFSAASAVLTPNTPPSAPPAPAVFAGNGQVSLSWNVPANAGSAITDYVIEISSNDGGTWTTLVDGASTTPSAVVTGLTNGAPYRFRVSAVNAAGTGPASAASAAVTPTAGPNVPASPPAPTPTAGNAQVALSWTAPATGGSAISDYLIETSTNNGMSWTTFADGVSTATSTTVTGLTNGTAYVFRVSGINAVGTGAPSAASAPATPVTAPSAPAAPTGTVGDGQVVLSWNEPATGGSAITDYVIEFSSNDGNSWTVLNDGVNVSRVLTVSGLTNGQGYRFRVSAVNAVGTSAPSAVSAVLTPNGPPPAPTVPAAPAQPTGTAGSGQVALTWSAPSNGGSAITDYVIEYLANNGVAWTTFNDGVSTATSATVIGLANGMGYRFRVSAVNAVGTGAASVASAVVTPMAPAVTTAPSTPAAPTGTAGNGQVVLSWMAPADGGSAITDYVVELSTTNGASWLPVTDQVTPATSLTITGLTNGTAYRFRVAAVNAVGTSAPSAASAVLTPDTPPSAPGAPTPFAGNGQVALSWNVPANAGSAITDYVVEVSPDNGANWTTVIDGVSTTPSTTVTGLTNGVSYRFRVSAVNAGGTSPASSSSALVTPTATATVPSAPAAPSGITGNGQIALSWIAPANGGSAITDYLVELSTNSGGAWTTVNDGVSSATSTTVTGLANGTSYVFRVSAINAIGTGAPSSASAALVPGTTPAAPAAPTGTTGDGQVVLSWDLPANGGSPITDYVVQLSTTNGNSWTTVNDPITTSRVLTISGLTNGVGYVFRVAAVNAGGTGPFSAASAVLTPNSAPPAATVPAAPAAPTGTAGNGQVALSWTAPSTGGSAITDYVVELSSNNGLSWTIVSDGVSTATSTTVTGLTNGIGYRFRVSAVNGVGTSAPSAASAALTPMAPGAPTTPSSPAAPTGTAGSGQVVLSWTAPPDGGSAITDYVVELSTNNGATWLPVNDSVNTATTLTINGLTNGLGVPLPRLCGQRGRDRRAERSVGRSHPGRVERTHRPGGAGCSDRIRWRRPGDAVVDGSGDRRLADHRLCSAGVVEQRHDVDDVRRRRLDCDLGDRDGSFERRPVRVPGGCGERRRLGRVERCLRAGDAAFRWNRLRCVVAVAGVRHSSVGSAGCGVGGEAEVRRCGTCCG